MLRVLQDYPFTLQLFLVQTYGEETTRIGWKWFCKSTLGTGDCSDADVKPLSPRKQPFQELRSRSLRAEVAVRQSPVRFACQCRLVFVTAKCIGAL